MKYRIKNLLSEKDIIPNIMETYPQKVLLATTEDFFYDCLYEDDYNVLCYHITRLTLQEIDNIRQYGLSFGGKELLYRKVNNLPPCCEWFKTELLEHIDSLYDTQADNLLCASYGYLDLDEDPACDNIFHSNWGGESIYRYYDHGDGFQNEHLKEIHETLQAISYPCIIVIRMSISTFCNADGYILFERLKQARDKTKISGSLYIEQTLPEVVDIIDLNIFDGIDFT